MSNQWAIATVTATLSKLLQETLNKDLGGLDARVTTLRPEESNDSSLPDTGVNIYLYQTTPNTAWRNSDLPTRSSTGHLTQRPCIALDLHYLLTFYGDESILESQQVLGSVMRALHARPLLTRSLIQDTIDNPPNEGLTFLPDSDLIQAIEQVKFTPLPLSLEELSKLWSILFQTPYTLSTAYIGSVVFLEAEETPRRPLPVRAPVVTAMPFQRAVIAAIESTTGEQAILMGDTVLIKGQQLGGAIQSVNVGGAAVPAGDVSSVTNTSLQVALTHGDLRAGVQGLQIIYTHGFASSVAPLVLRPRIAQDDADNYQIALVTVDDTTTLQVTFTHLVGQHQPAFLFLNEFLPAPPPGAAYRFAAEPRAGDTDTLDFVINSVQPGNYLVRVQISGAESALEVNDDGQYDAPQVTIT